MNVRFRMFLPLHSKNEKFNPVNKARYLKMLVYSCTKDNQSSNYDVLAYRIVNQCSFWLKEDVFNEFTPDNDGNVRRLLEWTFDIVFAPIFLFPLFLPAILSVLLCCGSQRTSTLSLYCSLLFLTRRRALEQRCAATAPADTLPEVQRTQERSKVLEV